MRRRIDVARARTRTSLSRTSLLVAAVAVAGLVLVGSGTTATSPTKPYTANICAGPGPCIAPVNPPTLTGGAATATVALTIKNQASPQSLGSANVGAPAGFTVGGVSPSPAGSSFGGTQIQLRNLNLAAGTSATFIITVSVPCQQPADPSWTISAKQSNNYNGPPGNDFTRVAPSSLTTFVTGGCKLVFVKQPADAQVGRTITSVDYQPAAAPVTVEVHDGSDALITSATGTVALTASSNASSFTGVSASLAGGVAAFPSLQSTTAGTYTVTASSTGYASSDPSSSFEIGSKLVYLTQPADAQVDKTITTVDYQPAVPPADNVKVAVVPPSDTAPYDPITTAIGSATLTPSSNTSSFSGVSASFSSGVATFSSLKSSAAGTYTAIASSFGSTDSPASDSFEIGSKLVFLTQPADAEVDETITTADFGTVPPADNVKVAVVAPSDTAPYDPITTATGSVTLTPSSNAGSFSGTSASLSSGVATFSLLESSATGVYTVTASSSGSTDSSASDPFAIADFGTNCPAGDTLCEGSAQSSDNKTNASVKATEGDGFDADTTLAITMLAGSTIPAGVCSGFTPLGSGVEVDVRPVPGMTEVTLKIDKSLVNSLPDNGASHFQFCFGGKIPTEQPPTTSFPTKDGTLAVFDPGTGLFWGLLPDCPQTPTTPCVLSRKKTKAGDFVGVYAVPDPWDQRGFTG